MFDDADGGKEEARKLAAFCLRCSSSCSRLVRQTSASIAALLPLLLLLLLLPSAVPQRDEEDEEGAPPPPRPPLAANDDSGDEESGLSLLNGSSMRREEGDDADGVSDSAADRDDEESAKLFLVEVEIKMSKTRRASIDQSSFFSSCICRFFFFLKASTKSIILAREAQMFSSRISTYVRKRDQISRSALARRIKAFAAKVFHSPSRRHFDKPMI